MQQDPPSSAPQTPPDAHAAAAPPPRSAERLNRFGLRWKRAFDAAFSWPPDGWLPIPTVTSLLIIALITVGLVEFLPKNLSDVTLSIRARTEVLEFELDPTREYVWWLPAGSYSLLKTTAGEGCETRSQMDLVCASAESTALVISNGATVHLETLPSTGHSSGILAEPSGASAGNDAARFSIEIRPRPAPSNKTSAQKPADGSPPTKIEIRSQTALLAQTHDLVTFESGPIDLWRIPLILKRIEIGESLTESIAASETLGGFRQPIMTQGEVRIFARSFGSKKRYQVQEESFDPADVVQIPADGGHDGLLLGLISLQDADGPFADQQFDLTLHTDLAEIFVRRLGAEHKIGVSMWSIVSQLPFWLALWIVWVSLIVVANYHAQRLGVIRGSTNAASKE